MMLGHSDSQSGEPSQDGGSSQPSRVPSSLPSQMPSPIGGQSSLPVGPPSVSHGPSFRPPSASSRHVAPSSGLPAASARPFASSVRPAISPSIIILSSVEPTIPAPASIALTPESASPSGTSTRSSTPSGEQSTCNGRSGTLSGEQTIGNGRVRVTLTVNRSLDKQKFSAICRRSFPSHPHGSGYSCFRVPRDIQNIYWRKFQKSYWDTNKYNDDQIYRAYKKKISARYSDCMSDLPNIGQRPRYVSEAIWKEWLDAWNGPRVQEKTRATKRESNRASWSYTHKWIDLSWGNFLAIAHLGRKPDPHELFMYTHTRRHDGNTWIDFHPQDIEEEYTRIIVEIESQQNLADELQAFLQAFGGANNRNKIYGLGDTGYRYFNSEASTSRASGAFSTSPSSSRSRMQSQLDRLQSTVDNIVAFQQRYGPEQQENHPDRLNLGTSSAQVQDVQEFQVQMRDLIEDLQNSIARMQQQIERLESFGDANDEEFCFQ